MLRQSWSALTPKAPYAQYQTYGWDAVPCGSAGTGGQEGCRSVPKHGNGSTERSGRMPFCAGAPERVDRKVREDAVLWRAPGQMSRKPGN